MGATASIVSAGVALASANQQRKAYQMQAAQYGEQLELSKLQADADVLARQNNLFYQIASLNASTAGSGGVVGNYGDSSDAFGTNERKLAANDIRNIKIMGYSTQRQFGLSQAMARSSAQSAMLGGLSSAAGTIGATAIKTPGPNRGTLTGFRDQLRKEWT